MIECEKCGRKRPLKLAKGWVMRRFPQGPTFYTCPSCLTAQDLADAMPLNGARGFMYDPESDSLLSRRREPGAELNRFDCACGWIVVDAGKAYMLSIARHRQTCPEGARRVFPKGERGGDDA